MTGGSGSGISLWLGVWIGGSRYGQGSGSGDLIMAGGLDRGISLWLGVWIGGLVLAEGSGSGFLAMARLGGRSSLLYKIPSWSTVQH